MWDTLCCVVFLGGMLASKDVSYQGQVLDFEKHQKNIPDTCPTTSRR